MDVWDPSARVVIVTGASSGIGALQTSEERIDIPHGAERADLTAGEGT